MERAFWAFPELVLRTQSEPRCRLIRVVDTDSKLASVLPAVPDLECTAGPLGSRYQADPPTKKGPPVGRA